MTDRIETLVVVTDKGSQTFVKVGNAAQQIDRAGQTGERGLTRLSKAGAATGAAFVALQGGLTVASRYAAEAEASQARLQTAIENTGHSLFEYEDALDAASKSALQLGFDDEDAADAIATLTTATGDAKRAIEDLSLAEDIARARKISLAAATQIVIAAEQGRTGALARIGIAVDENATKEQTLDALRAKFAGQAEAYAATEAGAMDRRKNQLENYVEAVGAALGPTQQLFMILPGLSAGFTGVGAAVGAVAPNLTAASAGAGALSLALGPVGIGAAALVGAGALIYFATHADDVTTASEAAATSVDDLSAAIAEMAAGGQPIQWAKDVQSEWAKMSAEGAKADDILNDMVTALSDPAWTGPSYQELGKQWEALGITFRFTDDQLQDVTADLIALGRHPGLDTDKLGKDILYYMDLLHQGAIDTDTFIEYIDRTNDRWYEYSIAADGARASQVAVNDSIAAGTPVVADFLNQFKAMNVAAGDYAALMDQQESKREAWAAIFGSQEAAMGRIIGVQNQVLANHYKEAAATDATTAKLKEQEGAYYGIRDGLTTASEAQAIFKQTQDGILASQGPFNQQLSEYQGQLNNLQAAEDLLNERRAAGVQLTKEQESFLARVDAAQARLQGGTEDATLALGEQALQYAENMEIGDEMNKGLTTLDASIQQLITSLHGIPGFVETEIEVNDQDAKDRIAFVKRQLEDLDGYTSHTTISVSLSGPGVGFTPGYDYQHGGVIPHAQHGIVTRDMQTVKINEAGGEFITLPGGSYITPAPASRLRMGNQRGGSGMTVHVGTMYVVANNPREFADEMRSYMYSEGRR